MQTIGFWNADGNLVTKNVNAITTPVIALSHNLFPLSESVDHTNRRIPNHAIDVVTAIPTANPQEIEA